MKKPEKYWNVTSFDQGRVLGNPDYIHWADERIAVLEKDIEKYKRAIRIFHEILTKSSEET